VEQMEEQIKNLQRENSELQARLRRYEENFGPLSGADVVTATAVGKTTLPAAPILPVLASLPHGDNFITRFPPFHASNNSNEGIDIPKGIDDNNKQPNDNGSNLNVSGTPGGGINSYSNNNLKLLSGAFGDDPIPSQIFLPQYQNYNHSNYQPIHYSYHQNRTFYNDNPHNSNTSSSSQNSSVPSGENH